MKQFPTGSGDGSANLARESQQHVWLLRRTRVSFERPHKHTPLVHTCQLTSSAPYCTDTVADMLVCNEAPHIKPENPAQYIRTDTQMETRVCFVRSQSQKGVWQAGASSTEKKKPVGFTKCSAVKLLRSFHRMVELTNTGAKLNLTGNMSVLTEGQMSANAQLNGSSLWQQ